MPRTKLPHREVTVIERRPEYELKWINQGGPIYINGQRIKHGDTFMASPKSIPKAFRDVISPLDPIAAATENRVTPVPPRFSMRQREESSFYDIYDDSGKRANEKDLTEREAKIILDNLT